MFKLITLIISFKIEIKAFSLFKFFVWEPGEQEILESRILSFLSFLFPFGSEWQEKPQRLFSMVNEGRWGPWSRKVRHIPFPPCPWGTLYSMNFYFRVWWTLIGQKFPSSALPFYCLVESLLIVAHPVETKKNMRSKVKAIDPAE